MKTIAEFLDRHGACWPARYWLGKRRSIQRAWDECHRGEWLWWALCKFAMPTLTQSRMVADWALQRAHEYAAPWPPASAIGYHGDVHATRSRTDAAYRTADVLHEMSRWSLNSDATRIDQAKFIRKHFKCPKVKL